MYTGKLQNILTQTEQGMFYKITFKSRIYTSNGNVIKTTQLAELFLNIDNFIQSETEQGVNMKFKQESAQIGETVRNANHPKASQYHLHNFVNIKDSLMKLCCFGVALPPEYAGKISLQPFQWLNNELQR